MAQHPCGIPTLFLTFLKIGAFTFGGGYAMIPLIQREVTEKRSWLDGRDILDIVAIAESTPGPIAINAATFVGYRVRGVPGAFFATLGVVVPAFLTILAVSLLLDRFQDNVYVQYAFTGIRAGILALMVRALWSMYRQCPKSGLAYVLAALALIAVAFFSVSTLLVIVACAVIGLAAGIWTARPWKK